MNNYKQLDAWKAAMALVTEIYQLTKIYPKEEVYGLTSQTKRAAVSIAANIAEGLGRQYKKDTLQFLFIARGSLYEIETLLIIAKNTGVINEGQFNEIETFWQKTIQLLNGFINYYEKAELK
jgi:four helix bundle protein